MLNCVHIHQRVVILQNRSLKFVIYPWNEPHLITFYNAASSMITSSKKPTIFFNILLRSAVLLSAWRDSRLCLAATPDFVYEQSSEQEDWDLFESLSMRSLDINDTNLMLCQGLGLFCKICIMEKWSRVPTICWRICHRNKS